MALFDENAALPTHNEGFKTPLLPASTNTRLKIKPLRSNSQLSSVATRNSIRGLAATVSEPDTSIGLDTSLLQEKGDGKSKDLEGSLKKLEKGYGLLRGSVKGWTERIGSLERSVADLQANIPSVHLAKANDTSVSSPLTLPTNDPIDIKLLPPLPESPLPAAKARSISDLNPAASPPVPALRARREKEAALRRASLVAIDWNRTESDFTLDAWSDGGQVGQGNSTPDVPEGQKEELLEDSGIATGAPPPSNPLQVRAGLATPQRPNVSGEESFASVEPLIVPAVTTMQRTDDSASTSSPGINAATQTEPVEVEISSSLSREGDNETEQLVLKHEKLLKTHSEQLRALFDRISAVELARAQTTAEKDNSLLELYVQEVSAHQRTREELVVAREQVAQLSRKVEDTKKAVDIDHILSMASSSFDRAATGSTVQARQVTILATVGLLVAFGVCLYGSFRHC